MVASASAASVITVLNAVGIASGFSRPHSLKNLAPLSAASVDVPSVPIPPWYSDPDLLRDRSHVIPSDGGFDYRPVDDVGDGAHGSSSLGLSPTMVDVMRRSTSRIIPFCGSEVYVRRLEGTGAVEPLLLRYDDCDPRWFRNDDGDTTVCWLGQQSHNEGDDREGVATEEEMTDYFAVDVPPEIVDESSDTLAADGVESAPVRNHGDAMPSRTHAALLAAANGLLAFHRTHRFCSACGAPTASYKAGAARRCTDEECRTSVYPRIDPAVIMLIESPCGGHALLGRNKRWPDGRYSTLAGFAEVGETLEECVVRETFEESGVVVDPASIRFVASQPWPFPRSMMVGFTGTALDVNRSTVGDDADATIGTHDASRLPLLSVDPAELEDAQWFSKEYVQMNGLVEGHGSSALDFEPDEEEAEFHVPGPASLARLLITKWVTGESMQASEGHHVKVKGNSPIGS